MHLPFFLYAALAAAQQPSPTPQQWAAKAAAAEAQDLTSTAQYLRYRTHSVDSHGDLVRDLIESKDGPVARLIYKENRPLTPQEDAAEQSRLQAMLDDPANFARHVKSETNARKQATDIIKLIPDAMLFTFVSAAPQQPGRVADIVLDFHPNPAWTPPSMVSEALTGIQGRLWLDPATAHPMRIEAHTFRPVSIGFGIFAKLFPGGTIALDEIEPAPHRWLFSHFVEHLTPARPSCSKPTREDADLQTSNFTRVDPLTYQQAIQLLRETPLPTH